MKKKKDKIERILGVEALPEVIRNCSVSLCVVAQELLSLDPNDWYARYITLIDSLTSTAEVLKEVYHQSSPYVYNIKIKLPDDVVLMHLEQMELLPTTEEPADDSVGSSRDGLGDIPF